MEWRVSIEDKNKNVQLSNRNSGRAQEVDGNKENTENTCPALSYNMVPVSELESAGIQLKRRWNQDENLAATAAMKKGTLMSKESHGSSLRGLSTSGFSVQAFGKGKSKPIPQMRKGFRGKFLPLVEDGGRVYRRRGQPLEPGPAKAPHLQGGFCPGNCDGVLAQAEGCRAHAWVVWIEKVLV